MRKLILLTFILSLLLVGCSRGEEVAETNNVENGDMSVSQNEVRPSKKRLISEEDFILEEKKLAEYILTDDISNCDNLTAENLKLLCNDEVNKNLAIKNNQKKYCDLIVDSTLQSECTFSLEMLGK